jgi:hypothetical protein
LLSSILILNFLALAQLFSPFFLLLLFDLLCARSPLLTMLDLSVCFLFGLVWFLLCFFLFFPHSTLGVSSASPVDTLLSRAQAAGKRIQALVDALPMLVTATTAAAAAQEEARGLAEMHGLSGDANETTAADGSLGDGRRTNSASDRPLGPETAAQAAALERGMAAVRDGVVAVEALLVPMQSGRRTAETPSVTAVASVLKTQAQAAARHRRRIEDLETKLVRLGVTVPRPLRAAAAAAARQESPASGRDCLSGCFFFVLFLFFCFMLLLFFFVFWSLSTKTFFLPNFHCLQSETHTNKQTNKQNKQTCIWGVPGTP